MQCTRFPFDIKTATVILQQTFGTMSADKNDRQENSTEQATELDDDATMLRIMRNEFPVNYLACSHGYGFKCKKIFRELNVN
ncbi:hypothetical protein KSF78_0006160 [Schistosoma japonicum]|nr:hypothetical protein KSF78_0006160 [Schistosoma japonicum]